MNMHTTAVLVALTAVLSGGAEAWFTAGCVSSRAPRPSSWSTSGDGKTTMARHRRGGAGTMSSTMPPQLPDVNQNLSGGDFDNWFWGDAHVKGGVEHAVFEGAKSAVVLFDGECNFCNSGVWMMISNSEARNLRFCAQNSEMGVSLLHSFGQDQERLSSIAILDKDGHLYTRSCALVHIMARMDFPFRWGPCSSKPSRNRCGTPSTAS
ncbi:unnamed protein product [Ectocarpus sp. 6 AP-2014]